MRIFYAAGASPNRALPESHVWRANLYRALVDLGHEVIELDYDLMPHCLHADVGRPENATWAADHRPALEAALLTQVRAAHAARPLDLFFSYFHSSFASAKTIRAIADLGITTVNWYCNASYQFDLVRDIAPAYSYCLVPEGFRLADYRAVGARAIYCQEAANPDVYRPCKVPKEFDLAFVGAAYGDRPHYIRALLDAGIDVHVWGPGWPRFVKPRGLKVRLRRGANALRGHAWPTARRAEKLPAHIYGGLLSDDEMVRTFSRSQINLGFSSVGDTGHSPNPIRQVRLRDFEVPMAGGFYLLEHVDEIEEFFVPGVEIACFRNADDLVAKARFYLSHLEEREAVRRAGYKRALRDHTWQKRLTAAFLEMGLPHAPTPP